MPRHPGLPISEAFSLSKSTLLNWLHAIDNDSGAKARVLEMETAFRERIRLHVDNLPTRDAKLKKFNTSPFVVLFYSLQHGYTHIHEIEEAILPAKVFSSMETSAGRMVESIALPVYSWEVVPSEMHSFNSALDGKQLLNRQLRLATLKSGPRCLNDEMSENFADAILNHCEDWAAEAGVDEIDFTYGVLYGTRRQSNKKDWHILRNIAEKSPDGITVHPDGKWHCKFERNGVRVTVTVRIGVELWNHIAGHDLAFIELSTALVRACVAPSDTKSDRHDFTISDLQEIISLEYVPGDFNVAILQYSQLEWLFFFAHHFCDILSVGDMSALNN